VVSCQVSNRRRISCRQAEAAAWEATRNAAKATLQWQFAVAKARTELRHLHPAHRDSELLW
jgi:hypothetical protein